MVHIMSEIPGDVGDLSNKTCFRFSIEKLGVGTDSTEIIKLSKNSSMRLFSLVVVVKTFVHSESRDYYVYLVYDNVFMVVIDKEIDLGISLMSL